MPGFSFPAVIAANPVCRLVLIGYGAQLICYTMSLLGLFSQRKIGRSVNLNIHLQLVPRIKMSGTKITNLVWSSQIA